jgi:uncharacterized cupin superfamily protein
MPHGIHIPSLAEQIESTTMTSQIIDLSDLGTRRNGETFGRVLVTPVGKSEGEVEMGVFQADPGKYVFEQGAPLAETYIVHDGEATILMRGQTYTLNPGTVFNMPAHVPFECIVHTRWTKFFVKVR